MIDYPDLTRKVIACSLCGAVLILSANGLICQNMNCPDYLLEKHEHVPEKYGRIFDLNSQTVTISGTVASSTTTTTTYPYINLNNLNKGGES